MQKIWYFFYYFENWRRSVFFSFYLRQYILYFFYNQKLLSLKTSWGAEYLPGVKTSTHLAMQSRIYIFIKSDNHSFHPEEWKGFCSEELCIWGSRIEFYYYSFIILGLVQQQIFSPWRSKFYCLDILPSYYKILWFCFVLYSIYVYFLLKVNRLFYWN